MMKDQAAPIGEAGFTWMADFSGILGRIKSLCFARILMRVDDSL
jgi:hypothetical protein